TATAAPPDPGWLADRLEHAVGDGGYRHLVAWQHAADQGDGTRSVGTEGFRRSADYLVSQLRGAGYRVTRQVVPFQRFRIDSEHAELTGTGTAADTEPVQVLMSPWAVGTPEGGVTAPVVALPDTRDGQPVPDAGCSADDYAGLPVAGAIVIAPRATCGFVGQQTVAAGLGARAVLSYLLTPRPDNIYRVQVFTPEQVHIPMGMVSQRVGERLAAAEPGSVSLHLELRATVVDATTENILAQTAGGRTDRVVLAGAHLDSVSEGPGIDDNATSAAAMLQIALRLAPYQHRVTNAVRFAWWGAEELIDVGSGRYVDSLDQRQRDDIALYLNAEVIAAPNFARFVMDGDDSDHPGTGSGPAPAGSGAVEAVLAGYYASRHLAYETQDLSNIGSDHEPFAAAGIPVGGIDGGTIQLKTAAQAQRYGGQAGQMFDSCYHQSCDDLANVDRPELARNAGALAFTVGRFALDVGDVTASRSPSPPRPTADPSDHTGTRGTPPAGRTATGPGAGR
ncbi:MAG: M28 family peptidase, partial [Actinocatenispora sp.]